jgi:heme-degrading monooxygenase HmoA
MPETYTMGVWRAKPGEEDLFVAAWAEFAEWMKTQPGVRMARLVRDLKEPAKFISFADWDGIESIHAWKATDEFKQRIATVKQHTDDFTAAEAELTIAIGQPAAVA